MVLGTTRRSLNMKNILTTLLFLISVSCFGQMTSKPYTKAQVYGYLEYLPGNYVKNCACSQSPLMIFLHGIGERGAGTARSLDSLYKHGPPKLIKLGTWIGKSKDRFVLLAPQNSNGFFNPKALHDFINYAKVTYNIDTTRIYLVGLSAGAISIWNYIQVYGNSQVAAVIPIAGNGNNAVLYNLNGVSKIPIWAFHGDKDATVNYGASVNPVKKINALIPAPAHLAKVTLYNGVGHDSWSRTFDLTGMSKYDLKYNPFDVSIYQWLLTYSKSDFITNH